MMTAHGRRMTDGIIMPRATLGPDDLLTYSVPLGAGRTAAESVRPRERQSSESLAGAGGMVGHFPWDLLARLSS